MRRKRKISSHYFFLWRSIFAIDITILFIFRYYHFKYITLIFSHIMTRKLSAFKKLFLKFRKKKECLCKGIYELLALFFCLSVLSRKPGYSRITNGVCLNQRSPTFLILWSLTTQFLMWWTFPIIKLFLILFYNWFW